MGPSNPVPIHDTKPQRRTKRRSSVAAVLSIILGIVGVALIAGAIYFLFMRPTTTKPVATSDGNSVQEFKNSSEISDVVTRVSPSIVSIVTSGTQTTSSGLQEMSGAGTGMIISKDGYVMTNKHVIDGARSAQIVLSDGTTYEDVKIIGSDPLNDVAFLKIAGVDNLTPVELGNSSTVKVGQQVIAIGNSLGQYQNTVTSGIISGIGRPVEASDSTGTTSEQLHDLLQTDAAINPGNSGGPLLNAAGQVIGINTAVVADAQSLGFSIPINATKGEIKGLLASGTIKRAYLGLRYVAITPDVAKRNKLASKTGAYITADSNTRAIVAGGPADKAGILSGDIILKVGDTEVGSSGDLMTLTGMYQPGDKVDLTVLRDGKQQTISVELGSYTTN